MGPKKRAMPGAPIGVNTGKPGRTSGEIEQPCSPRRRAGPSHMPASTTSIGCNVIGTGVHGSGIAICDAAATREREAEDSDDGRARTDGRLR